MFCSQIVLLKGKTLTDAGLFLKVGSQCEKSKYCEWKFQNLVVDFAKNSSLTVPPIQSHVTPDQCKYSHYF